MKEDMGLESVKKVKGQRLGSKKKSDRRARAADILKMLESKKSKITEENLFFSDEKISL